MTKVADGYWWARYEGPDEIVEVKRGMVFRHCDGAAHWQHEFKFLQPVDTFETLNLRDICMQQLEKAASESEWMPPEYCANDWQADCCNYLRYGGTINFESPTSQGDEWKPRIGNFDIEEASLSDEEGAPPKDHAGDATSYLAAAPTVTAKLYGDLDFPAPNHYDPDKRGFSPK